MSELATITITCKTDDRAELEALVRACADALHGRAKIDYRGTVAIREPRPLDDAAQSSTDAAHDFLTLRLAEAKAARAAAAQAAKDAAAAKEAERIAREAADAELRERQRLEDGGGQ